MKQKLIPAPIDEKNVCTDWIESVFDNSNCITGGKHNEIYTGFVAGRPTNCYINKNRLFWNIDKLHCGVSPREAYEELLKRLKEYDDSSLIVKYDTSMKDELLLLQKFYWEEE